MYFGQPFGAFGDPDKHIKAIEIEPAGKRKVSPLPIVLVASRAPIKNGRRWETVAFPLEVPSVTADPAGYFG